MTIRVKNVEYFDWEIPDELLLGKDQSDPDVLQELIDDHFNETDLSVAQANDSYFEYEEILS